MKELVLQRSFIFLAQSFIRRGSRDPATCSMKLFATVVRYGLDIRQIMVWKLTSAYLILMLCCCSTLRVRSYERRNELKPVWDFILVENLTSVFSQLFTCVHMNWGEMKLKTVWISYRSFWLKWNFKPAWDFHVNIIYPKRDE